MKYLVTMYDYKNNKAESIPFSRKTLAMKFMRTFRQNKNFGAIRLWSLSM